MNKNELIKMSEFKIQFREQELKLYQSGLYIGKDHHRSNKFTDYQEF